MPKDLVSDWLNRINPERIAKILEELGVNWSILVVDVTLYNNDTMIPRTTP
ncbi:MAG: hypothetical protein F7C35_08100 [Desulfurococcales archaeon]|nr:hypothetical protein [Desulfurococcales archaeon]